MYLTMAKNEKQGTLVQCSKCEGSSSYIIDHHIYVCPKCGFTRDLSVENTQTEEKNKMWPYTEEEWDFVSNSQHVPPQDKDSHEKKDSDLEDSPYLDWDDYPYIPISQWLYRRH